MSSVKTRVALAGAKYLVTHPRSRITRIIVRFAIKRLGRKLLGASRFEEIPALRGSRLATVAAVAAVAGTIVVLARRAGAPRSAPSAGEAAGPASSPQAPPRPPAAGDDDDALVARVQDALFGGTPPPEVSVESRAGVVTLRGRVADEASEGRWVRDAENIPGVRAVQSELHTASAQGGGSTPS